VFKNYQITHILIEGIACFS